jgi:heme oxygenase
MNLSEGQGTAFYEFADITDEKAFKAKYRQTLDELPLDDHREMNKKSYPRLLQ